MRLSIRRVVPSVACLGVFALLTGAAFAQSDPQVGVWKLNIAKSKYSPGPAPKSGSTRIEAAGAGAKVTVDQELADGTKRHWEFTANYDGKDSPVTGNPRRRYGRAHAHRCGDGADRFEESWKGDHDTDICRVERWQDQDGHDHGCQCQRAAGEQRRSLRKAVAESDVATIVTSDLLPRWPDALAPKSAKALRSTARHHLVTDFDR